MDNYCPVEYVQSLRFVLTSPSIFVYIFSLNRSQNEPPGITMWRIIFVFVLAKEKESLADNTIYFDNRPYVLLNDFAGLDEEYQCKDYLRTCQVIKHLRNILCTTVSAMIHPEVLIRNSTYQEKDHTE